MRPARDRFQPCPDVLATRAGEEVVLIDLKTDRIYSLNRTAARAWELLCEGWERAEVERRMLMEFDVAPDELARAIDEVVASLMADGLLVPAE